MKICKNCGAEIDDKAVICVKCGCPTDDYIAKEESQALSICALIFSILGGWLGLVLNIIGICVLKEEKNRKLIKIGFGLNFIWLIIFIIIFCSVL